LRLAALRRAGARGGPAHAGPTQHPGRSDLRRCRMSEWKQRALCARPELAPLRDLFFPGPKDTETAAKAKQLCAACPVRQACLDDALKEEGGRHYRYGIRGGLSETQRRREYEKRRKAVKASTA